MRNLQVASLNPVGNVSIFPLVFPYLVPHFDTVGQRLGKDNWLRSINPLKVYDNLGIEYYKFQYGIPRI